MPKLLILWLFVKNKKNGHCARSYSQFYGICRGRWIVFMTEPITLYHDFPAKGVPHIFWTIRLKCLLAQITVPWHFYGPIQFQDYTAGYFLTHERTIHLPQKYRTTVKLQQHIFFKRAHTVHRVIFWIISWTWSGHQGYQVNQIKVVTFCMAFCKRINSFWLCSCRKKFQKLTFNLSVFSDSQRTPYKSSWTVNNHISYLQEEQKSGYEEDPQLILSWWLVVASCPTRFFRSG